MTIKRIYDGEALCAVHIGSNEWTDGLNFFSEDDDFVQVGTWKYDEGKRLQAHYHNPLPREIGWTQEVLFVKKGSLQATVYGLAQQSIDTVTASEGDVLILLRGGHGYEILENATEVLEIKNGPYLGPERDRTRI